MEHEVIDAEVDELLHLLDDLLRCADEGVAGAQVEVLVEFIDDGFVRPTKAAAEPGAPQRGRVASKLFAGLFALLHLFAVPLDACPSDKLLWSFFQDFWYRCVY